MGIADEMQMHIATQDGTDAISFREPIAPRGQEVIALGDRPGRFGVGNFRVVKPVTTNGFS